MRELKKSASLRFLSILGSLSAHTGLQFYFSETAGVNASYSTSTRGGGGGVNHPHVQQAQVNRQLIS